MRLLILVLALLSTNALAAPGWSDPSPLPFDHTLEPAVAFADGPVLFEAHLEVEGTVNDIHTRLIVTRHGLGEAEVEELRIESTPTAVPAGVRMAVAPNGAAVIAFGERTSNDLDPLPPLRWRAAYRSADGTWEAPVTLFTDLVAVDPGQLPEETPHCSIAPDGTAVAGASHVEPDDEPSEPAPGQTDVRIDLVLHPAGGAWQAPQRLSPENDSSTASALRVDGAGNFLMAWSSRRTEGATGEDGDDKSTILVKRLLAGSTTWTGSEDVTGPNGDVFMDPAGVAVGSSGRAVIAFSSNVSQAWAAARDDASTPFGAPVQLVTTASSSSSHGAAVADDGTAYVLYDYDAPQGHVGMVRRSPGGTWTDETPVSPLSFQHRDSAIAFAGSDAIAVWTGLTSDNRRVVQATRWPAGAGLPESFEEVYEGSATINIESVASDRAGSVVATWGNMADGRGRAVYDAGAPALTGSTIPTGVIAGVSTTLAATFLDAWSDLAGEPVWAFADGSANANGGSVAHTFANPGTYDVTATAADAFGNTRESTFPVTVSGCESLAGTDGVTCRCTNGLTLGIAVCDGATLPSAVAKKFGVACQSVTAAQTAGAGRKGRKAATKAAKSFKTAARVLAGKKGKAVAATCRDVLGAVLGTAKDRATALKGTL
ncbi:MAG TPA: PKD domain-containing protein [Candidatus Binatia bacterium]|jgi:hypothetical protein|nr:PKD domain-containing protein [Candidatus Binatia bacterium]